MMTDWLVIESKTSNSKSLVQCLPTVPQKEQLAKQS